MLKVNVIFSETGLYEMLQEYMVENENLRSVHNAYYVTWLWYSDTTTDQLSLLIHKNVFM